MNETPMSEPDASTVPISIDENKRMRRRALFNTFSNVSGQVLVLGFGFILTPFIIHQLGPSQYGLWVLVSSIVAYGVLLDLGIASAVIKYVAEYRARGDHGELQRLVSTSLLLYMLMGLVALLLSIVLASVFTQIFQVPAREQDTAYYLILLMGISTAISIPCSTTHAVLRGLQRFDQANLIAITGSLLNMLASALALWLGGGVIGMVAVGIPIALAMQIPAVHMIHKNTPQLRITVRHATRRLMRTVFSYSWVLFIGQISGQLQNRTDEIVIGATLPVSMVTPYALGRRLSDVARLFAYQFVKILLPLSSELNAKQDHARMRDVFLASSRMTLASFVPIAVCLIMLARPILTLWVGPQYSDAAIIVVILIVASFFGMINSPATAMLQGMSRHRLLALISIGAGISNLVLSLVLVRSLGVIGVALGTLIPSAIESLVFLLPYCTRVIGVSIGQIVRDVFAPVFLPALPMVAVLYVISVNMELNSFLHLLLAGSLAMAIYAALYLCMRVSSAERQVLADVIQSTHRFLTARFGHL